MDYTPVSDLTGDLSFAAPAKIRILLTPVSPLGIGAAASSSIPGEKGSSRGTGLSTREFERWANEVRAFASIKLSELPRRAGSSGAGRLGECL